MKADLIHVLQLFSVERHPSTIRVPHTLASPESSVHSNEFESIPHIAVPPPQGQFQYIRPLGGEDALSKAAKHHGFRHRPYGLRRSLSAPDVHLATRFLRRSRAAKQAKPKKVALFQPHRMTLGMRRDLLRGARPRMKNVREMESDAGSAADMQKTALQQKEARQKMRAAHNKRIEEERVEQLRERVRLFGIKVATRAAQIKATRAKLKHHRGPSLKMLVDPITGLPTSASKRNNSKRKSGGSGGAATDATAAGSVSSTSAASSNSRAPYDHLARSDEESKQFDPSNFFSDNSTATRVRWSILTDPPTEASLIPLPAPGSQQEADLIQHLAEKSIEREQQLASQLDDSAVDVPPLVEIPIVIPDDDTIGDALLALPVTPSVIDTPRHRDPLAQDQSPPQP